MPLLKCYDRKTLMSFCSFLNLSHKIMKKKTLHPDDQTQPTFDMTPGFKPFTENALTYKDFVNLVPGNSLMYNVVVQFYPWFKLYFPLFLGMIVYDNEIQRKIKFKPRKKLNHNIYAIYRPRTGQKNHSKAQKKLCNDAGANPNNQPWLKRKEK